MMEKNKKVYILQLCQFWDILIYMSWIELHLKGGGKQQFIQGQNAFSNLKHQK